MSNVISFPAPTFFKTPGECLRALAEQADANPAAFANIIVVAMPSQEKDEEVACNWFLYGETKLNAVIGNMDIAKAFMLSENLNLY